MFFFGIFVSTLYLPSLHLFDQKYSKKLILILQFKVTEFKLIEFLWAHLSAAFKCVAHETETWTFLIIIHFENSCAAFSGFSDEEKELFVVQGHILEWFLKDHVTLKTGVTGKQWCNIVTILLFYCIFDQINAALMSSKRLQ